MAVKDFVEEGLPAGEVTVYKEPLMMLGCLAS
jgi:hypothetical protein